MIVGTGFGLQIQGFEFKQLDVQTAHEFDFDIFTILDANSKYPYTKEK